MAQSVGDGLKSPGSPVVTPSLGVCSAPQLRTEPGHCLAKTVPALECSVGAFERTGRSSTELPSSSGGLRLASAYAH